MSKAFTKEDDAGLTPASSDRPSLHAPHTAMGRDALRAKLDAAEKLGDAAEVASLQMKLAAGLVAPPEHPDVASLGAEVTLRAADGRARVVRLVTADEVGLVERGASPTSPIGAAVVGACVGDEIELPGGAQLVVQAIAWPSEGPAR